MFHTIVFIFSLQDCSDFQLHFAIQACAFYIDLNMTVGGTEVSSIRTNQYVFGRDMIILWIWEM